MRLAKDVKASGLQSAWISDPSVDRQLSKQIRALALDKVELESDGTMVFGCYSGRTWFFYVRTDDISPYVSASVHTNRAHLMLSTNWHFVSSRPKYSGRD